MAQIDIHVKLVRSNLISRQTTHVTKSFVEPIVTGVLEKADSANDDAVALSIQSTPAAHDNRLQELFTENVLAKVWRVANRGLEGNSPPVAYPEFVPQDGIGYGRYTLREADFWTCGFFPGTLYSLLERISRYPHAVNLTGGSAERDYQETKMSRGHLLSLCRSWSEPLHAMSKRTDTHDLGFIVEPALRLDWELTSNKRSLNSLVTAAHSLASRFDSRVGAIRSWDLINKKDLKIISMEQNFIVIIDSLCNLDLLFYASSHSENDTLAAIARKHATTLLRTHLRPELLPVSTKNGYEGQLYSTCHVANLAPETGNIKQRMTAQGYADSSTWARGQAWAILGYAQTYTWTKEAIFLETACGLAEYFLQRLGDSKIPLWDFDAPIEDLQGPVLDSSAGAIAANGMLLISEALAGTGQYVLSERFQHAALDVIRNLLEHSLSEEKARFVYGSRWRGSERGLTVEDVQTGKSFDAILKNATANNNVGANKRYWNHGLVYADYYLVRFGNELLRLGLA